MSDDSMAIYMDFTGLKVYMTRDALKKLADELLRISQAPPEECFEVHVRSVFSRFDKDDNYISPQFKASSGLAATIEQMHAKIISDGIRRGEYLPGDLPSPFELTFMHVSTEAVKDVTTWPDD
ncbi:hypothetical protein [Mesorhizobium sp.]|uniref:hypothetical protein n=1 Tax=Mesorhizobium sp. TaxID=1871066 RepID=UPI000FE61109|nr:hypothetical protein [Mesorhizobium sp.]RWC64016.1 MAG: hypothetical protein EOS29_13405 [Mesorhizobium sp.]RWC64149.1 MAG: hypothetical protein EOS56_00050 [Mesorhizobium sp.]